jgi:hypothetical protein
MVALFVEDRRGGVAEAGIDESAFNTISGWCVFFAPGEEVTDAPGDRVPDP